MGLSRSVAWTCDYPGCNRHGTGSNVPKDWTHVRLFKPGSDDTILMMFVCPVCSEILTDMLKGVSHG